MNCIDWNSFSSLEQLNDQYYSYVTSEYNNHFHSSINMSPRSRFMEDYQLLKFVDSDETLNEWFLHTLSRKVATDSTISLFGKSFEVPSRYMKQKIIIKFEPTNLNIAYIYENGKKVETIYPVKKVDNSRIKRNSISYAKIGDDIND